jgi:ABC-type bacteriocin/lantibiotic exporter with double-glycine peptidase domain
MWLGARQEMAHKITLGDYFTYTMFLAFMVAPVFQVVNVGTQLTEAIAGLDRTSEILAEKEEDAEPKRTVTLGPINGDVKFEDVHFAYEPTSPSCTAFRFMPAPARLPPWWALRDRANPPSSA